LLSGQDLVQNQNKQILFVLKPTAGYQSF